MKKTIFLASVGVVRLVALAGCNTAEDAAGEAQETLILATQLDANSPFGVGFERFKEVIEEETNGEVTAEIHTDGSLGGNEDLLLQSIASGAVDMTVVSPGFMTQAIREVDLFSMPYLFTSEEHWERVVDGEVGKETNAMIEEETNLRVLGYWSAGVRNFYGFHEVNAPEDLQNVSIRTQDSPAVQDAWSALGAIPTSVAWDEMYQALQNRVVDASENDFTNMYQSSHHEVTPYISLTEHDFATRFFLTSDVVLERFDAEQQEAIWKAAEEATLAAREADREMAEDSLKRLEEEGAVLNEVDTAPFMEQTEHVREQAAKDLGALELYEAIQALAEE
ncbi:TRAP transporter substrate-binding protein [Shouchella shacheensis]|uniref:TRAP transporter substrate-binding protein n=1 Tax=Shouchella shacheensis TaxID=1649580 RepID=UPI00073FF98E|nr:TRAP transporter substrate-binding protein [Shouchella shacheensis]